MLDFYKSKILAYGLSDYFSLKTMFYVILACIVLISLYIHDKDEGGIPVNVASGKMKHEASNKAARGQAAVADPKFANRSSLLYGVDIAHYQGDLIADIDYHQHLSFIITKATQGAYYVDRDFYGNWRGIKAKGLIRGAYHFYDAEHDPVEQADHFFKVVGMLGDDEIAPIIDVEELSLKGKISAKQLQEDVKKFLERAETRFGRRPMLYTDYSFAQQYFKNPVFAKYPLWLAEYSRRETPLIPDTWGKTGCKIWQKSDSHSIDSIKTDFDIFEGSRIGLVR